jgi:hypothetical protein
VYPAGLQPPNHYPRDCGSGEGELPSDFNGLCFGVLAGRLQFNWVDKRTGYATKAKMTQRAITTFVEFLVTLGLVFLATGCQMKCQQLTEQLTSLSDKELRMAETTDPTVRDLTNTNFITMSFFNNYTGEVHKVQNNNRFNAAALVFTYNVNPDQKTLKIQYSTPATEDNGSGSGSGGSSGGDPVGNPKVYTYTLSNQLMLTDTTSGFTYRFVPFEGIVKPDQKCTF